MSVRSRIRSAIALEYDGNGAPRVTAKGKGEIADQILAIAAENGVPIREDRDLALLLSQIELGDEIPTELYVAIAEVLHFAYRLSGKAVPRPGEDPS